MKNFLVFIFVFLFIGQNSLRAEKKTPTDSIKEIISEGSERFGNGDFVSTIKLFYKALKIAERNQLIETQGVLYSNLSAVYRETAKYDMVDKMAKKALECLSKTDHYGAIASTYNNWGLAYYERNQDSTALSIFNLAIKNYNKINDKYGLSVTYRNLGALYDQMGDTLNAIKNIKKGMSYLTKDDTPMAWFHGYLILGEYYVYSGHFDQGKVYLDSASTYLPKIHAVHKYKDYHYAWHAYYKGKGNYKKALEEYYLYKDYADSILGVEKSEILDEITVKYETEKKDKKITEQKLKIEQEKNAKIRYTSILSFVILIILILLFYLRRSQKLKTQRLIREQNEHTIRKIFDAEQKERIRIARDLHDSIGQKLSVMKMLLTSKDITSKADEVSNFLDETATEVRAISHNLVPEIINLGLSKAIENLVERMNSTDSIHVHFSQKNENKNKFVSKQTELSLYRIIQEITSNIIRHSQTKELNIELEYQVDAIQIVIVDHGVGFDRSRIDESNGLGWKNIFARIKLVNGKIKINSEKDKGSNFLINIPIA